MADYKGTLQGHFSVDPNGGADYEIKLDLPPGIAGAAPHLSVKYSSLAQNGIMGMGWNLKGLSVITRTGATLAQDGFISGVSFQDTDRLSLDGSRLMATETGSYFDASQVYNTEIQSWQKVVPVYAETPTAGRQGPDSFEVYHKNGSIAKYGATSDSQGVISSNNPTLRAWYLSSITDLCGNTISFAYEGDGPGGYCIISKISYTSNESQNVDARRFVRFQYEARTDTESGFIAGYPIQRSKRLSQITTSINTWDAGKNQWSETPKPVTSYNFAYEYGSATGRSRLTSITRSDGSGKSLSPTTFSWQEGTPNFSPAAALDFGTLEFGGEFMPMDISGNGWIDFVNAQNSDGNLKLDIYISKGDGTFEAPASVSTTMDFGGQLIPLDANGDGKMELLYVTDNNGNLGFTLFTPVLSGTQWTLSQGTENGACTTSIASGGDLYAADVDGNGMTDLVYAYSAAGQKLGLKTLFSTGSSFQSKNSAPDKIASSAGFGGKVIILDANANGMEDVLYVTEDNNNSCFTAFISGGPDGFTEVDGVLNGTLSFGGDLIPLDVNNDGNTDLLYLSEDANSNLQIHTLLNDGTKFSPISPAQSTGQPFGSVVLPSSLTGNSSPDLTVLSQNDSQLVISAFRTSERGITSIDGIQQPHSGTDFGGIAMPLDLRGRGFSDLVYAFNSEQTQKAFAMTAAGKFPDLLNTISNGLGGTFSIDYLSIADPVVYSQNGNPSNQTMAPTALVRGSINGSGYGAGLSSMTPIAKGGKGALQNTPFVKYVVSKHTMGDGLGNSWSTSYKYEGALVDHNGRGWLGFSKVRASNSDRGTTHTTSMHQQFPLTHMVASTSLKRTIDEAHMATSSYQYKESESGVVYQVFLKSSTNQKFSFTSDTHSPETTLSITYGHDSHGNVILIEKSGDALAADLTTVKTYSNDEDNWQIGFLTSSKKYADTLQTTLLGKEKFEYHSATMKLKTHKTWDDVNAKYLATTFTYDGFGNKVSETLPGTGVFQTAFESVYNTFIASRTSKPNTSTTLTESFTFSPEFGHLISKTDPNGAEVSFEINGIGRVTAESHTSPANSLVKTVKNAWSVENNQLCKTTQKRNSWDSEDWSSQNEYFDAHLRKVGSSHESAGSNPNVLIDMTLNEAGAKLTESLPYFKGASAASIKQKTWQYDAFGRPTQETKPASSGSGSNTTALSYPQFGTVETTKASGHSEARTTTIQYKMIGKKHVPVQRKDEDNAITSYTYDGLGKILKLTEPTGIITEAGYDTMGRQVSMQVYKESTTYLSRTESYQDKKRISTETTSSGILKLYHDKMQRIIKREVIVGPDTGKTTYEYDGAASTNGLGRLTRVTTPAGDTFEYSYDPAGNIVAKTVGIGKDSYTLQETYHPNGKLNEKILPDGSVQSNAFDSTGILTGISFTPNGSGTSTLFSYSGFNEYQAPSTILMANGVVSSLAYDDFGRVRTQSLTSPSGTSIFSGSITMDNLNQIISEGETGKLRSYSYSNVGRLKGASGTSLPTESFSYDQGGSIRSIDGFTVTNSGFAPTSIDAPKALTATYSDTGALLSLKQNDSTVSYTYDGDGRLLSAGSTSFQYDDIGRLLVKKETAQTTYYVFPGYEVVKFTDGSSQHTCYVVQDSLCSYAITTAGAKTPTATNGIPSVGDAYYIRDQRKSVRVITDGIAGNGTVTSNISYLSYGLIHSVTGSKNFRYSFCGREYDQASGSYYFGARFYNPQLTRFITPDDQLAGSLSSLDTSNLYAYVINDPITLVDPSGHSWDSFWHGLVSDVVGTAVSVLTFNPVLGAMAEAGVETGFDHGNGKDFGLHLAADLVTDVANDIISVPAFALAPETGGLSMAGYGLVSGALTGIASGFVDSIMDQEIFTQKINWNEVGLSAGVSGAVGGVLGLIGAKTGAADDIVESHPGWEGFLKQARRGSEMGKNITGGERDKVMAKFLTYKMIFAENVSPYKRGNSKGDPVNVAPKKMSAPHKKFGSLKSC